SPDQRPPQTDDPKDKPDCQTGSTIECQNQILGESVEIVGAPFTVHYYSDRVAGRLAAYNVQIALSAASPPASLARIELVLDVAGRHITQSFSAAPNQSTSFTWDGRDAYGRTVLGHRPISIRVGYVYKAVYQKPNAFGQSFAA